MRFSEHAYSKESFRAFSTTRLQRPGTVGIGYTLDGSYEPCFVGVAERGAFEVLTLFPNPATHQFTVSYPHGVAHADRVQVTDIAGRIVIDEKPLTMGQCVVDTDMLSEGSYVVSLFARGALVGSGRVSVQVD
ncbi:MAG: T9SS type A sorting domain-containing protein, partial [Flavobacteriales bacterium]